MKPQPPAKKKQAKLDLSPPSAAPSVQAIGPGRAAGASRPPGITRSGENDDFGRGVIRALRATMPPPNGTFGRVTVRLLLNNNGDLAEVQVLEPSGKPGLDQNVVFSTKQAYFPLPPSGCHGRRPHVLHHLRLPADARRRSCARPQHRQRHHGEQRRREQQAL